MARVTPWRARILRSVVSYWCVSTPTSQDEAKALMFEDDRSSQQPACALIQQQNERRPVSQSSAVRFQSVDLSMAQACMDSYAQHVEASPGACARHSLMHAMRSCVARSPRWFNRGRVAVDMCGPVSGWERPRRAVAAIVGAFKSLRKTHVSFTFLYVMSFFSRATARLPPNARTVAGSRPFRIRSGADGNGTSIRHFFTANSAKLFPRKSELTILPHLQPLRCTRSTYARMSG